jgi:hypothetical protein
VSIAYDGQYPYNSSVHLLIRFVCLPGNITHTRRRCITSSCYLYFSEFIVDPTQECAVPDGCRFLVDI